jgi:uracil-DNA glycosylase
VLQASRTARILIVGQAPGRRVHASGRPFDDPSGDRLRDWLGVDREAFYDPARFSIVPMGFCYPGTGKAGDLPPRPECAATWRAPLMEALPRIETTIALGRYALDWHWPEAPGRTLADACRAWRECWPGLVPMPHPSPRNNRWLRQNSWFERDVVPALQQRVRRLLAGS